MDLKENACEICREPTNAKDQSNYNIYIFVQKLINPNPISNGIRADIYIYTCKYMKSMYVQNSNTHGTRVPFGEQ